MKDRLDRAEERKNRYIAERVEQAVTHQEPDHLQQVCRRQCQSTQKWSPWKLRKQRAMLPSRHPRGEETKDTMDTGEIPIPQAETEGEKTFLCHTAAEYRKPGVGWKIKRYFFGDKRAPRELAGSLRENDAGIGLRTLGVRTRLLREEGSLTQGHDHCGCACGRVS